MLKYKSAREDYLSLMTPDLPYEYNLQWEKISIWVIQAQLTPVFTMGINGHMDCTHKEGLESLKSIVLWRS